jgi:hypothetical protein
VTDPLASDEDRHLDMKSEVYLLERRGMVIPHQIVDQSFVFPIRLRPFPVRDTGALDDSLVTAKIIDQSDEPMIEQREFLVQNRFRFGNNAMCHIATPSS